MVENNLKDSALAVDVPDPISGKPKLKKMSIKRKAILVFLFGFLFGWAWITWGNYILQPYGLDGLSYWYLLLPF